MVDGVSHGAAGEAAAPGRGQRRSPGIPEPYERGGEVEEYEWEWEARGEEEPQLR